MFGFSNGGTECSECFGLVGRSVGRSGLDYSNSCILPDLMLLFILPPPLLPVEFQFQFQFQFHFHFSSSLLSTTPFSTPSAPIVGPINVVSCEFVALRIWVELVDLPSFESEKA